jgi:hypothetical protein
MIRAAIATAPSRKSSATCPRSAVRCCGVKLHKKNALVHPYHQRELGAIQRAAKKI